MFLNREFAQAREIIQKFSTLESGKFVKFIKTFGHLVSFSYNLMLVLWTFNKILELANNFSMQNHYSKTFLDVKFLFVNWFSKFLLHILGLKEC